MNPLDGAGLFCGVIQYLLGLENESHGTSATPKVLAATHFHEIFHSNLLDESLPIDFVHMEAMLSKGSGPASDLRDAAESIEMDEEHAREESAQIQIHYLYRLASIPRLPTLAAPFAYICRVAIWFPWSLSMVLTFRVRTQCGKGLVAQLACD